MNTKDLIQKYRHVFSTNYTEDVNCQLALLMDVDEDPLTDSSQNSNTGALSSAGHPNFETASPPAAYSTGYYLFDGISDAVTVAQNASLDNIEELTILNWGKTGEYGSYDRILDKGYKMRWECRNGKLMFSRQMSGDDVGGLDNVDFGLNTWHHTVIKYSHAGDKKGYMYIDGVFRSGASQQAGTGDITDDTGDIKIANRGGYCWDGPFDEFAIFDRCLDLTEINDVMDNGLTGIVANPYPIDWLNKKAISGYHCFMNAYLKAKVLSYDPLKLPDGTIF